MALYGSVPFLMSHKKDDYKDTAHTVGFFWLNAAETWVDVTKQAGQPPMNQLYFQDESTVADSVPETKAHWMSETGVMDFFVFTGSNPAEVMQQYFKLTGSLNLPQQFALGYHQCRWNYIDEDDVAKVHDQFEENDIPMDVLWLDIEHTNGKRYFTWHDSKFPTPIQMQESLAKFGRKMVTIIDPHIFRDDSYHVKKMGSEQGLFVKTSDGKEFDGWCWPGRTIHRAWELSV